MSTSAGRALARLSAVAVLVAATLSSPLAAQPATRQSAVELSRGVSQGLLHLQEVWLHWISAFYQNDRETAATQITELHAAAERLGFTRLPELSMAATVRAIAAARQGDLTRAEWALDDAESLDPGRPETAFGRALAAWEGGKYHRAVAQQAIGYTRLFHSWPHRGLALTDLLLAGLAVALLAGAGFVLVQLAVKGSDLYWSIHTRFAARFPGVASHVLTLIVLVWPLAVPGGVVWALLYWSVLLWAFASLSERIVIALMWILLGGAPFVVERQQQRVAVLVSPPARAVMALTEGRLYGALFSDLAVLPTMVPDSPAVRQLLGDLHSILGQHEDARADYMQVIEKEANNVTALVDVGAFHFRRGDHGTAVQFFQRAAAADATNAAAYYNLSQAYSDAYQFGEQHEALNRARQIDEARVNAWIQDPRGERVVTFRGGFDRREEILASLAGALRGNAKPVASMRRWLAAGLAGVALLLALALQRLLPKSGGPTAPRLINRPGALARLLRVLLPGVPSAEDGNGGRAYLAILVIALVLVLVGGARLIYPLPLGLQPGSAAPLTLAGVTLVGFFASRVWLDLH